MKRAKIVKVFQEFIKMLQMKTVLVFFYTEKS